MALQKNKETRYKTTANYHRITEIRLNRTTADPMITVEIGVYESQTARNEGGTPMDILQFRFPLSNLAGYTPADLYAAIKAEADQNGGFYQDAVDV